MHIDRDILLCSLYPTNIVSGATAAEMNISLLTADFWSVLAGVALLGSKLSWCYPPAFIATLTGLVLFYYPKQVPIYVSVKHIYIHMQCVHVYIISIYLYIYISIYLYI